MKSAAVFLSTATVLIAIATIISLRPIPTKNIPPGQILHTSCYGYSGTAKIQMQGKIKLNKLFLENNSKEEYRAGILQQLKFVSSYYNGKIYDSKIRNLVFSYETPDIEIIEVKNKNYGSTLTIDGNPKDNQPSDIYVSAAMKHGATHEDDPSVEVTYKAQFNSAVCSQEKFGLKNITFELPIDPYLAYWSINPNDRRPIRWGKAQGIINPCAESEYVDIPNPNFYWYFWDPRHEGFDENKKSFNCRNLLDHKNHFIETRADVINFTNGSESYSYSDGILDQNEIQASVIFGWLNTQEDSQDETDRLVTSVENLLKSNVESQQQFIDKASASVLVFIRNLKRTLDIKKFDISKKRDHFVVKLSGNFINTKKKINLNIFWGPSDVLGNHTPRHWNTLRRSLAGDDLVIYAGHSGLGMNFDLSNDPAAFQNSMINIVTPPKEQVVAILSCFSYAYFSPQNFNEEVSFNGVQRDYIYTASNMGTMTPTVSELIRRLDKKKSSELVENIASDDFFVVKRFIKN